MIVPADALSRAIKGVLPACSTDRTLPLLNGMHISTGEGSLILTGTDRYRIHRVTLPMPGAEPFQGLISLDDAKAIVKYLGKSKDPASIGYTLYAFTVAHTVPGILVRLESTWSYPNVAGLIPKSMATDLDEPIALNPKYLADIGAAKIEHNLPVFWSFTGPRRAAYGRVAEDSGVVWEFLIMPVRAAVIP